MSIAYDDDDDEIVLSGTYTSPTKNHKFNVAGHTAPYFLGLEGISKSIADVVPSYARTQTIKMSDDEFEVFKTKVLDQNVQWVFRNVIIPGTWRSVSVGGKRSSCRRSSCRRSSCRRSSCRRSSCRRSSYRRGHRRTKHH